MEQNKFEQNIKEVLEKRRIKPSVKAWDKLETKLDNTSEVRSLKTYYWIAASVIVLIAISMFILNPENSVVPQVVETIEKNKINTEEIHIEPEISIENKEAIVESKEEKELVTIKRDLPENKNNEVDKKRVLVTNLKEANKTLKSIERKEKQVITFEEQKINEVIKEIQIVEAEKGVTEVEIDALLLAAQREIDSQKNINKTGNQIDAMTLLQDVENELDKTFKDKVLDLLKQKVIEVAANKEN